MEKLIEEGKMRSLGVSNFDVEDLDEAIGYLRREKIACNQVLYNLGQRGIERRLIPYCMEKSIAVVGYTPFGKLPSASSSAGILLRRLAEKYSATVRQIVLAFLVRDQHVFAIPKAANVMHVEENAKADQLKLDRNDISTLSILPSLPRQ